MTYWKYGDYQHPDGEVNLARMNVRTRMSPRNLPISVIFTLFIQGELCCDGQDAVTARIEDLIDAYSVNYQSCGLYDNAGVITRHALDNDDADNISGVIVKERSWPKGGPEEYANTRTFSVTLEAEFAAPESQLIFWEETLRFIGNCGPRFEIIDTYAIPFNVQTATATSQRIIQTGSAVGFDGYITPATPIFPDIEHQERRDIMFGSPKMQGQALCYYPTSWTYHFTAGTVQTGNPGTGE